jgi:hypothetical protein
LQVWPVSPAWRAGRPQRPEEADEQLGARHEARGEKVFLTGVRPGTYHTETIKGRHTQRPGEVPIAAAASRQSFQRESGLSGLVLRLAVGLGASKMPKRSGSLGPS